LPRPIDWARLGLKGLGFSQYAELAHLAWRRGDLTMPRFNSVMKIVYRKALAARDRAGADRTIILWETVKRQERRKRLGRPRSAIERAEQKAREYMQRGLQRDLVKRVALDADVSVSTAKRAIAAEKKDQK
jgi:hypothetical protein